MAKRKKRRKPRRKHYRINIATVISLLVLTYLLVRVVMSAMQPRISTYEVTAQKINDTVSTTGLALRSEKLVTTSQSGYVTYYVADGEKVGVNSTVYAMDQSGSIRDKIHAQDGLAQLSDTDYVDIKNAIIDYKNTYQDSNFATVYDFKYALDNTIMEITNDSIIQQVNDLITSGNGDYSLNQVTSGQSGVISYCYDGLEDTTIDMISPGLFKNTENHMKQIRSSEEYAAGSPVYRLVTDENWELAVPLNDIQYEKVKSNKVVKKSGVITVKFLKDDLVTERPVTFIEKAGNHFAVISLNKYMERYIDERYLDIDLILDSEEGLKIPNSSLLKTNLYKVPIEYGIESDDSASGISFIMQEYSKAGERKAEKISPTICYKDKKYYYLSKLDVSPGDVLIKNTTKQEAESGKFNNNDTYTISASRKFQGVYTINKGYAQFIVIDNLYQGEDFCIAKDNTEFGVSQYDHVVLDSKALKEGQIIY